MTDDATPDPIPMSSPDLSEAEREAVAAVLRTPRLSLGPQLAAFEAAVARYVGSRFAVGVSSGTAGLHLALLVAGVRDGDLGLTTPFSFVASANVFLYERAVPVFVDVDPATGNIDPTLAAEAVRDLAQGGAAARRWLPRRGAPEGGRLKVLLTVDAFGQPADHDPLLAVAREHGLLVVEDACEALGSTYRGRPAGTLGDLGVFAFYPNKQVTTGEGGMVVTDREDWADLLRALRNQGRAPGDTWLEHTHLGYNYRMSELNAALGVAQMARIEDLLARRARVAAWYEERLAEIPGLERPRPAPTTTRLSWFVYVVRLPAEADRRQVMDRLAAEGVPTRPYFTPIHLQPYFRERFGYREGDFPVTEDLGRRSLALPFSGVMGEGQVDRVCRALRKALGEG